VFAERLFGFGEGSRRLYQADLLPLSLHLLGSREWTAIEPLLGVKRLQDVAGKALRAEGWSEIADDGFIDLVGPFYHRLIDGAHEYAVAAQPKHRNIRGFVQGGLLMTFADRTMGLAAYQEAKHSLATVQMDTQFVDTAKIGELLLSKPRVIRATRSLIFMSTEVKAAGRCTILATAVFKIFREKRG